jgi:hypothetical protein
MATIKRIAGDYTIQTIGATDRVNINTNTLTVNGNLTVTGNATSINTTNTTIWDNIITLNANVLSNTAPTLNAGIEVNRGSSSNVALRWNETVRNWQVTTDGSTYGNILTTAGGLTANLNITGYRIYDTNYNVQFYANTPAAGGSGVYTTNNNYVNQELITKQRSIAYSIIFG